MVLKVVFFVNCNNKSVLPKFLNFRAATKSLKSSRTYHQCQLSLLHEEVRQKDSNIRLLRKKFDILHYTLQVETSFIDFARVPSLFLGYSDKVLEHKSTIQQKKFNKLLKDKKPQHDPRNIIFS